MKPNGILLRLFAVSFLLATHGPVVRGEILAGLAEVDITPPVGGLTRGYSSAKPTVEIHDPLSARILVLKSSSKTIALVTCDLCVYNSPRLHQQVRDLGFDGLLLCNTHTHAGPNMAEEGLPNTERPWKDTVDERIVAGIREAHSNLFPAYFKASQSQIQLGYNRLVRRGNYAVTHFENPQRIPYGKVDPTVGVVRITDDNQRVRAILVNYACHPVILGPRNRKISADYPGVTRSVVESQIGGDCMCLFLQGGAGDINPLMMARGDDREKDFEVVEAMGQLLADEVARALSFIRDQPGISDSMETTTYVADFRNRWEPKEMLTLGTTTLLLNNEIAMLTLPGEPFHKFQADFRNQCNVPHALLLGYCCNEGYEWPRYLPDLLSAARGGYGASDTTVAQVGAGEQLVTQGLVGLFEMQGRLKRTPQRHTFAGESPEPTRR